MERCLCVFLLVGFGLECTGSDLVVSVWTESDLCAERFSSSSHEQRGSFSALIWFIF